MNGNHEIKSGDIKSGGMRKYRKMAVCGCLFFALLGITAYHLFNGFDLAQGIEAIKHAKPWYLLLALATMGVFLSFEAICMKLLTGALGYKSGFMRCYKYSLIDFYFSGVTPGASGGQPAQACYMKKDGIPLGVSSLCLLSFNMMYHLVVPVMGTAAFAILYFTGHEFIYRLGILGYFMLFGAAVQVGLTVLYLAAVLKGDKIEGILIRSIDFLGGKKWLKTPEKKKAAVSKQLFEYREGAGFLKKNPLLVLKIFFFTVLHLGTFYMVPFWIYKALGFSELGLIELWAIQVLLTLAVESLPLPGGIGASEGGFLTVYGSVFTGGALVAALLLYRGISYYSFILIGGATAGIAALVQRKKRLKDPVPPAPFQPEAFSARSEALSAPYRNF